MHIRELENLINEYKDATTIQDAPIKWKLNTIVALLSSCDEAEFDFAAEITAEFCGLIRLLKKQHKRELEAMKYNYQEPVQQMTNYCIAAPQNRDIRLYRNSEDLLEDFYNHFKKPSELAYSEVRWLTAEEKKSKANLTLMDYVARIHTFANKYLGDMFSEEVVCAHGPMPVLFVYDNIEYILAKFNTKDEAGTSIKQRVNIRSALRKLNEFKRFRESEK